MINTTIIKQRKDFYSVKELADILKISRISVFRKIKNGEIKGRKVGRNYVIPQSEVEQFVTLELTEKVKKEIEKGVSAVIRQYGEVLKKLGKE
jgi:excisionase family DNA binding protein